MISIGKWFNDNIRRSVLQLTGLLVVLFVAFMMLYNYKSHTDLAKQLEISTQILKIGIQTQNRSLSEMALNEIHLLLNSTRTELCRDGRSVLSINSGYDSCKANEKSFRSVSLPGDYDYQIQVSAPKFTMDNLWIFTALIVLILVCAIYFVIRKLHLAIRTDLLEPTLDFSKDSPIEEIANFRKQQREHILTMQDKAAAKATFEMAKQVAHDVRSPLSALNAVVGTLKEVPEEKRILIRGATQRINDIANNLLQKGKSAGQSSESLLNSGAAKDNVTQTIATTEFLPAVIDILISEKRMQFREFAGLEIEVNLSNSFGAFANINASELKRVISNLINNSVEAFSDHQGKVTVNICKHLDQKQIEVTICDNGKGIPDHILAKLGSQGVTHGKDGSSSGSGIGIYHAMLTMASFGGKLLIESKIGAGTTMRLIMPLADTPNWFAEKVDFSGKTRLVSLDDDTSIHQIWSGRLQSLGLGNVLEHIKFQSGEGFQKYVSANMNLLRESIFLIDYELLNQAKTGLDWIEELGLEKHSILVTSRYEEPSIQQRCKKLGLKILPKSFAGFIPMPIQQPKTKYDLILLDDDELVKLSWQLSAEMHGKTILCLSSLQELQSVVGEIDHECTFYVDANLSDDVRGEAVTKDLYDRGFRNIYLATGYESNQFGNCTWLKGVVGKDFPLA